MTITYRYTAELHYQLRRLPNPDTSQHADPTDDSEADYETHPNHPRVHPDDVTSWDIDDNGGDYLTLTLTGDIPDRYDYTLSSSLTHDQLTHELEPCDYDGHEHISQTVALQCALASLLEGIEHTEGDTHYYYTDDQPDGYGHRDPICAHVAIHVDQGPSSTP